jgi:putative transcriptional regulator
MGPMADDPHRERAEAYALGALDAPERAGFESHLSACQACRVAVAEHQRALGELARSGAVPPDAGLREHVLNLAEAPRPPIDLAAYDWQEVLPGVRFHVVREDAACGIRTALVWAKPGARYPKHRHLGDEDILVLQGSLSDGIGGTYRAGEICRSRAGSVHSEEALPGEDCVCFVVYYGEHEMLEPMPTA